MAERELVSPESWVARLQDAQQRRDLVCVDRSIEAAEGSTGYVVGVGAQWILLSVTASGSPDGWLALRTRDVTSVESAPGGRFVQRGLEFQRSWPPAPPTGPLPLSSGTQSLLAAAARSFTLVSVVLEQDDPFSCLVGRPLGAAGTSLVWQPLSSAGAWEPPSAPCPLAAVTRIEFGGQYHRALTRVSYLRSLIRVEQGTAG